MTLTSTLQQIIERARVPIDALYYLDRNEVGDAELFCELLQAQVVYDHSERRWYLWRGGHWQPDLTEHVLSLVANVLVPRYAQAAREAGERGRRTLLRRYRRRMQALLALSRANNVLQIASKLGPLSLDGREWEVPAMVLPVANGLLDLKDGSLREALPQDHLRVHAPTPWLGLDCPAPRWEKQLDTTFGGDPERVGFVQRLLGYAISGDRREQVLPIFCGSGANGKSTLVDALAAVLGPDLSFPTQSEALMDVGRADGNSARPFIVRLREKRLVWASESREDSRLNVGLVKQLTGDESITARDLYARPVMFRQSHTLILITNHRPRFPDADDEAIWRRVLLVPFEQRFVDDPRRSNEHRRQRDISAGLREEASGILAWLARGCLEWQRVGLNPPAAVQTSTAQYRLDEDLLGQFIEDCAQVGDDLKVGAGALYRRYVDWCTENGHPPVSARGFGLGMGSRFGRTAVQRVGRRTQRFYAGVGLSN